MSEESFPQSLWAELEQRMHRSGPDGVNETLAAIPDPSMRREAWNFALSAFGNRDWQGKNLDALIAIGDEGIAEGLRGAGAETTARGRASYLDFANVCSFNLSAALADCWPDDVLIRERRHFERGLAAAERCLGWRRELRKGPTPFTMAHWAEGYHLWRLGEASRAVDAMAASLEYAERGAAADGKPTGLDGDSTFFVILGHGYLGLARTTAGEAAGRAQYERAITAFERQVNASGLDADDAQFGIDQLAVAERRASGEIRW